MSSSIKRGQRYYPPLQSVWAEPAAPCPVLSSSPQVRVSQPWPHKHPGGDHFWWGPSCALQGVRQHPCPLPTRRQGHPCSQITQVVSSHCQGSPGGRMAPAKDHCPGEGHYPCSYSPFEPEPLAGVPLDFLALFPPFPSHFSSGPGQSPPPSHARTPCPKGLPRNSFSTWV